jgi:hypothetical protein
MMQGVQETLRTESVENELKKALENARSCNLEPEQ